MPRMEQIELDRHHGQIVADVRGLIDKYRAIFDWDVPEIDQTLADKLILGQVRKALEDIERQLLG